MTAIGRKRTYSPSNHLQPVVSIESVPIIDTLANF